MRIFALETNQEKLSESFASALEPVITSVRFHGFLFFLQAMRSAFWTIMIAGLAIGSWNFGLPIAVATGSAIFVWVIAVLPNLLRGFIDWKFDTLILTTEKLVIVNQSSIFRRQIRQMSLENLASAAVETQFWDLLPLGRICFDLKEGTGQRLCLDYIPHANEVCTRISRALVEYGQRKTKPA